MTTRVRLNELLMKQRSKGLTSDEKSELSRLVRDVPPLPSSRDVPEVNFYKSREWRQVRYDALKRSSGKCECCGKNKKPLHVDHIKPRSKYQKLELDIKNLQVLCDDCNLGKGARDETDWRGT